MNFSKNHLMKTFLSSNDLYEHKNIITPYVEPTVQEPQTIEIETKDEIDEFLLTASEFNKLDAATNKQKKVFYEKLFGDVQYVTDSRQTIDYALKTEDIFIEDELFSDTDTKNITNLVDIITTETDVNYILFDHEPLDVTPNVPSTTDPTLDFSHVLLPKNKGKNKAAEKIEQSIKNETK